MANLQIRFKLSYCQEVDYWVYGDGAAYTVTVRYEADPYLRTIYNGDESQWQREIVASVGVLHTSGSEMVKPEVLQAFREQIGQDEWRPAASVVTGWFNHDPAIKTWVKMPEGYAHQPRLGHESFDKFYHCYSDREGWHCDLREVARG